MIILDISRLLARALRTTPTGIDRVELAYAQHLLSGAKPVCFAVATPWRSWALAPSPAVQGFIEALALLWRDGAGGRRRWRVLWASWRLVLALFGWRKKSLAAAAPASRPSYLLVSHRHLERRRALARLKRRYDASFVCLIHDLIPIEFPEYARRGQDKRHRRRIAAAAELADAMIVPSAATGDALCRYLGRDAASLRVLVAPLGIAPPPLTAPAPAAPQTPYFVCLGTIEPRKNHLLLLNLWRVFAAGRECRPPGLMVIGRRGWESENTLDMLERCPALQGVVTETGALCDRDAARLLENAAALLLPSFAEGFGFPLAEALALGIPVLASDTPALREVGGDVPEYLDPCDGAAWRTAIRDYARDPSPRCAAQRQRLAQWRPPSWADHFGAVDALLEELATTPTEVTTQPTNRGRDGA